MYFHNKYQKLLWGNINILLNVQPILLEISFKKFPFIKGIFLLITISKSSVIAIPDIDGNYLHISYLYA